MRGREGGKEGEGGGEEGEGGGRRGAGGVRSGGGRREKRAGGGRGEEKREGGERGQFCAREARAAPEGWRETRGWEGEVRGREGERLTPLSTPL